MRSAQIEPIRLDVTDAAAIRATVDYVILTKGRIDVLVNNARFGQLGAIECVSMEAAHRQFEINVFGYACFMQAVLPHMRACAVSSSGRWSEALCGAVSPLSVALDSLEYTAQSRHSAMERHPSRNRLVPAESDESSFIQ